MNTVIKSIDELKTKLVPLVEYFKNVDYSICVHPENIELIKNDIDWIISSDKINTLKLDYSLGEISVNDTKVKIISTLKMTKEEGLRVFVYPAIDLNTPISHVKIEE